VLDSVKAASPDAKPAAAEPAKPPAKK
jgi:hypothetical protein